MSSMVFVVSLFANQIILLAIGILIGVFQRDLFSFRWLVLAVLLLTASDSMLSGFFGVIPTLIPSAQWNWQGKVLNLILTLIVAALPRFGWKHVGLTLQQKPGSLKPAIFVILASTLAILIFNLITPVSFEGADAETLAFQLLMPGIDEEPVYRGILLVMLGRAFCARRQFLGVAWGWGATLSSLMFGLVHALSFSEGKVFFDITTMAIITGIALILVWLRLYTGSLLLPIILHNLINTIGVILAFLE
ncbi:CPBP family intramembrane glutamic endopeptidase, BDIM_20840 family [Phytohalomonas tamaricis]|uniref:CPBP family intramembrane glutamic endopeptidase, BDIM_20840 family n=1 Tax=Phytohalomonas tamaricis TaxID=2081032 RepID=UPI0021D441C9|nr:CPBP family intramembrane glutamic endopeptidase [Phytohalomonas tamaricis]